MQKFFNRLLGKKPKEPYRNANDPKRYKIQQKKIGVGTFGVVFKGKDRQTGKDVAAKKIPVDARAEEELKFNLELRHINVIRLLGHYREARKNTQPPVMDLFLIMEYSEKTLKDLMDKQKKKRKPMAHNLIMLYTYQMFRALHYLHSLNIMHRDVKPSNFLITPKTNILKVCDFGSATRIVRGEARSTRVMAEPYRALELELGNQDYNEKIDIWAAGCIFAELCINDRLFREPAPREGMYKVICCTLGDPKLDDICELQPLFKGILQRELGCRISTLEKKLNGYKPPPPPPTVALIKKILQFKPSQRPSAIDICADPVFNCLRQMPEYDHILYNFSDTEIAHVPAPVVDRLVPPRCRKGNVMQKIAEHQIQELQAAEAARTASLGSGGTGFSTGSGESGE